MKKGVLILKVGEALPGIRERRGDFEDWIGRGLGGGLPVRVADGRREALPDPAEYAGVVVTGSRENVTDGTAWMIRAAQWLSGAVRQEVPLLGICFGHQILAYALGGEVGPNPAGRNFGTVSFRSAAGAAGDPLFRGFPDSFPAQASHAQRVLRLPPGAVLLASADADPHAAFRAGSRVWGVQFHPEFDAGITADYVDAYRKELAAGGLDPDRLISGVRETPEAAAILRRFAEVAAAG
ncbi:MAG: glutamine amidotransferase [Candidatus Eisenbacteria bacterium]|nr:glutamine amidotransferase [Candidatus Eisenbacteria bacterium]